MYPRYDMKAHFGGGWCLFGSMSMPSSRLEVNVGIQLPAQLTILKVTTPSLSEKVSVIEFCIASMALMCSGSIPKEEHMLLATMH
mmetsp:Transcript_25837/g.74751  ORF Transcript_25837/g.74751 Transcript_25837/m.74751 type:complete len:85 (+) Transcript_25837:571-825(+)